MKLEYSTGAQYGGDKADQFLQEVLNDPKNKPVFMQVNFSL